MSLIPIEAGAQNYAWGRDASESFVAKMKGLSNDASGTKYAELWVGIHPSCPSRIAAGDKQLLSEYLSTPEHQKKFFSPAHQASKFRGQVPYLLKILSIGTALSIQAHPNKALAEKLHAEKPDKYKDPNHKPELICALTPFEALCCFRVLGEVVHFVKASPELAQLLDAEKVFGKYWTSSAMPAQDSAEEKKVLHALMEKLYSVDDNDCKAALKKHLARVQASPKCPEDKVFARVYSQYPDDIGCWMVYILNYVQMVPGQALFLSDSEPHAYINGEGVEIMANSDNVVRAGLTPKWKDVPTLVSMLKYDTTGLASARHEFDSTEKQNRWQRQFYQPPAQFPDFSLYRFQYDHNEGNGTVTADLPTIGLGFCLKGSAKINGVDVKECECFAVPFGKVEVAANAEPALIFIASTNTLDKAKM